MATYLNNLLRMQINRRNQKALKKYEFSVFSSNCNGACICHDLGLAFNSPFVDLWISPHDFIALLRAPREYLGLPLVFQAEKDVPYPSAKLGDLNIWFEHYASEAEAEAAWKRRCKRILWDRLFIMMTDRDGCTFEDLRAFDALPYANKVVFTHVPYPELQSAFHISGFEQEPCVGVCSEFVNGHTGRKWYDAFDYVKWFNEGI